MSINKIHIKRWNEDDFSNSEGDWQKLLSHSSAHSLFLSWHWMHSWWHIWGKQDTSRLYILAAYIGNNLVGIAPLYYHSTFILKNQLTVKRIELLGTEYRKGGHPRAEYLQFIIEPSVEQAVAQELIDYLIREKVWDEIVLQDLVLNSKTYHAIQAAAKKKSYARRSEGSEETYVVDCTGSFSSYVSSLGRNTRLKFYNRRKELEKHGTVDIRSVRPDDLEKSIDYLNDFHLKRWSSLCFDDDSSNFIMDIARKDLEDEQTFCSEMVVGGKVVSVLFNLKAGNTICNIQSGFIENFDRKISLGTLHLGYYIESLFENSRINAFDLLAGKGQNVNYKSRLCSGNTRIETIQIVKSKLLRFMYSVKKQVWDRLDHRSTGE